MTTTAFDIHASYAKKLLDEYEKLLNAYIAGGGADPYIICSANQCQKLAEIFELPHLAEHMKQLAREKLK